MHILFITVPGSYGSHLPDLQLAYQIYRIIDKIDVIISLWTMEMVKLKTLYNMLLV